MKILRKILAVILLLLPFALIIANAVPVIGWKVALEALGFVLGLVLLTGIVAFTATWLWTSS